MIRLCIAHRLLFDQGILYHGISPETILLAKDSGDVQPGREGFLSDLDFCDHHLKSETTHADAIHDIRDVSGDVPASSVAKCGAIRTVSYTIFVLWLRRRRSHRVRPIT